MPKQTITPNTWVDHFMPEQDGVRHRIETKDRQVIALIPDGPRNSIEHADANAQAIAAVPDMIEALLKIRRIESGNIDGESWALADAALRKAGQID